MVTMITDERHLPPTAGRASRGISEAVSPPWHTPGAASGAERAATALRGRPRPARRS